MWTQDYDLHSHSTDSDGEHSVEYVAQLMSENDVKYWSLTDHDTISGWSSASKAAKYHGIKFIPGVEITCKRGLEPEPQELDRVNRKNAAKSWHLLAYFPELEAKDCESIELANWLKPFQNSRIPRMKKMVKELTKLGMEITFSEVAQLTSGSIGRPHLAEVMVNKGYVKSKSEAFDKWIGDGSPAHIEKPEPSIEQTVKLVRKLGGITSLAHPFYYGISPNNLAKYCDKVGIDSIEAFHKSHPDYYRYELWQECIKQKLTISCGSDFHGLSNGYRPGGMAAPLRQLCF